MLFNSYSFIFVYFPLVLLGFFLIVSCSSVFSVKFSTLNTLESMGYWPFFAKMT